MKVPLLLGEALDLGGALLLVGHLQGVKSLMDVIFLQLLKMFRLVVNLLILKVLLLLGLMLM